MKAKILNIKSDEIESSKSLSRSIGVASTGYLTSQQKWIVKTYSELINQKKTTKILIVSCYVEVGLFKHLYSSQESKTSNGVVRSFSDNLSLVDWTYYINQGMDEQLMSLAKNFNVIFWDFPEIEYLKKHDDKFAKYIPLIDDLKILSINVTQSDQDVFPESVRNYFREHGLPLEERNRVRPSVNEENHFLQRLSRLFKRAS